MDIADINKVDNEKIKDLFEALNNAFEKEDNENYEQIKDLIKANVSTPEKFHYSFTYKIQRIISVLIKKDAVHQSELVFLYENYDMVNLHFQKLFQKYEGWACSADKSRTITCHLARFFRTGKYIEFDYSQEYTYHLPEKIFKTHDEIFTMFYGIWCFSIGNPIPYIENLKTLLELYNIDDEIEKL